MISCTDLTLSYGRQPAIHHLTATIADGALIALIGPNGAGKSTLLRAIAGAPMTAEGTLTVKAARIGWLPQQAEIDRTFPIDVQGFVAMGLWAQIGALRPLTQAQRDRITQALIAVGLPDFHKRSLTQLSGGQMQRVLFARLILEDADLCLLDEPFAAIDARTTEDLMTLIKQWHQNGRTIVAVVHDMDLVRRNFPETLLIARGTIAQGAPCDVITEGNLHRARVALGQNGAA